MVGDPSCHSGRRRPSLMQTLMRRAKVIHRADQEHALVQRQGVACQCPAPPRRWRQAFPECRIQPFDICRVDHPIALRATPDRLHACRCAIHNAAFGRDQPSPLVTLDDLGDEDLAPWSQSGPSALARIHRITKGLPNGTDVGHQAIGAEQQWTVRGTAPNALDQAPDQRQITLLTDLAAQPQAPPPQPQARLYHHGQGHPHNAALFLDTEFVSLYLSQVAWLLDQRFVYGLALTVRGGPPRRDGTLVEPKRCHDGLHGAPMGEQGHHEHHGLCRGAQPVEDGPCAGAEGFATRVAEEALLLLRMDTNSALAGLASRMAVRIGAEYRCGVHDVPPGSAWKHGHEKYVWTPVCFTTRLGRLVVTL